MVRFARLIPCGAAAFLADLRPAPPARRSSLAWLPRRVIQVDQTMGFADVPRRQLVQDHWSKTSREHCELRGHPAMTPFVGIVCFCR